MRWSEARLGDFVEDARSGFASGTDDPQGVLQVRMNNVTREGTWDLRNKRRVTATKAQVDRYGLRPGDVLFNATNSPDLVGKTALLTSSSEPMVFSNHFIRLRARTAQLNPGYLARWLQFQFGRGVFRGMCRQWVNQATVGRDALLATNLRFPAVDEQRRIADILDRADAVRAKRREALTLLDDLFRAAFHVAASGDPSDYTTLRAVGVDFDAGHNIVANGVAEHGCNRVIKVSAVSRGEFDPSESKPLPLDYVPPARHQIRSGDILFGRASGSPDLLGASVRVEQAPDFLFLPDKVWRATVRAGSPIVNEYLFGVLQSDEFRSFVRHHASGAAGVYNIRKSKVLDYQVRLPPIAVQEGYATEAATIRAVRRIQMRQLEKLDGLFHGLQQRAFAGEL